MQWSTPAQSPKMFEAHSTKSQFIGTAPLAQRSTEIPVLHRLLRNPCSTCQRASAPLGHCTARLGRPTPKKSVCANRHLRVQWAHIQAFFSASSAG